MPDSEPNSNTNKRRKLETHTDSSTSTFPADDDAEPRRRVTTLPIYIPHHQDPKLVHYLDGHHIVRQGHTPFKSGGFCDVFTGDHPIYGKVALRRPRMTEKGYTPNEMKNFFVESTIWKKLQHPNILKFIGLIQSDGHIWAVSRFAENGSLPAYLEARPQTDRCALVFQLADAIRYLHREGIVHGDIKGSNILISAVDTVLLCDFGLSKLSGTSTSSSLSGAASFRWCAPEILFDEATKTCASDVFSFGMTVYEILSGNAPYHTITNDVRLISAIKDGHRPPREPAVSESGDSYEELWDIASESWDDSPPQRPTMEAICDRLEVPVALSCGTDVEHPSVVNGIAQSAAISALPANDTEGAFGEQRASRVADYNGYQTRIQNFNTEMVRMVPNPFMSMPNRIESETGYKNAPNRASADEKLISEIPRAHARYDDTATKPSRVCHPGTRTTLLQTITNWIDDDSSTNPFFFLCGEVGVGKSTVAHTIAKGQDNLHQLGGSFFFNRDHNDRRHSGLFAATIAYQLSRFDPAVYQEVADVLRPDPDIVHRALDEQVRKLVIQPLVRIGGSSGRKIVLVVDGLDECSDPASLLDVLPLLAQHTLPRLRVLITSRPHAAVVTKFQGPRLCHLTNETHFRHINSEVLDNDIRAYLEWSLADIASEYRKSIPSPWPSPNEIDSLVYLASGLFIIASTYDRYIRDPVEANPAGQLKRILSRKRAVGSSPTAELDLLYDLVLNDLRRTLSRECLELAHRILQLALLSCTPCYLGWMSDVLDCEEDDVLSILRRLSSVIPIPDRHDEITFFHTSFGEYVQDPKRCHVPEFLIESANCHARLAIEFLNIFIRAADDGFTGVEYQSREDVPRIYPIAADELLYHLSWDKDHDSQELQQAKARFYNRAIGIWMHSKLWVGANRLWILKLVKDAYFPITSPYEDEESLNPILVKPFLGALQHLSVRPSTAARRTEEMEYDKSLTFGKVELKAFPVKIHNASHWCNVTNSEHRDWGETSEFARLLWKWSKLDHPNILPLKGIDIESLGNAEKEVTVYFPSASHLLTLKRDWYPALSHSFRRNGEEAVKAALEIAQSIQYVREFHPKLDVGLSHINIEDIVLSTEKRPMICPLFLRRRDRAQYPFSIDETEYWQEPELTDWLPYYPHYDLDTGLSATVWRFGCILYEMMTEQPPLEAYQDRMKTVEGESGMPNLAEYFHIYSLKSPDWNHRRATLRRRYQTAVDHLLADLPVSDDLKGVLQACWVLEMGKRPTIQEIVARLTTILEALRNRAPDATELVP